MSIFLDASYYLWLILSSGDSMLILFKDIVLVMFICMCLYICACVNAGAHRDQEGLRSPVTGVLGDCELSDMHVGD